MARCFEGGYVGGTKLPIPEDPHRHRVDFNDFVGCNRLVCPTCSATVRHHDNHRISGWLDAAAKQALYDSPTPTDAVFQNDATQGLRVYFCRCSAHTVGGFDSVEQTEYAWSCGGHPES